MCTMISAIIAVISSVIITLFALSIGGYPSVLKVFYYLHFPPARFYFNAMQAIEKLEALSYKPLSPANGDLKQGVITVSDIGFRELMEILRQKRKVMGEVEEIVLGEISFKTGLRLTTSSSTFKNISLTPNKMRFLGLIQRGSEIVVQREQFDVGMITRNLKEWALEITRNRVANWILGILAIYLIASLYLVLTSG
jgi:hypothetical protein